jgi:hypothetical protein
VLATASFGKLCINSILDGRDFGGPKIMSTLASEPC